MGTGGITHFIFAVIIAGFSGIAALTILLREMLIVFSGSEFSMGIIIGSWIAWDITGAFLGGKIAGRMREHGGLLCWLMLLFAASFPFTIYLIRIAKTLMGSPPDMGLGIVETLFSSLVVLLPTGFFHGMLFSTACAVYNRITGDSSSKGKIYFYEMLGTIAGGVLVSYILIPMFNSFEIAIGVASLNAILCLSILLFSGITRKIFTVVAGLSLLVISVIFLAGSEADKLHLESLTRQWQGTKVITYENSPYQNIVVTKNVGHLTFFSNTIPIMTIPSSNKAFVEVFSHIPLLAHTNPETILVLGGGTSGAISETLKHPGVKTIDYVEMDPWLLMTAKKLSIPSEHQGVNDTRVVSHYLDGRRFVKEPGKKYDVILLDSTLPLTLQANRFFTQEFFSNIRKILNEQGILSLYLSGPASHANKLKAMNACMYRTIKSVFPNVFVVPGNTNLLIASGSSLDAVITPVFLSRRLAERGIRTNVIDQIHLDSLLQEDSRQQYISMVDLPSVPVNRDFAPKGLYYNVVAHNLLAAPYLMPLFDLFTAIDIYSVAGFFGVLFLIILFLQRKYQTISVPFAITTSGFAAISFQVLLLFGFQIVYGYVFYEIGVLVAVFMAGLSIGSILTTTWPRRGRRELGVFMKVECCVVLLALLFFIGVRYLETWVLVEPLFVRIAIISLLVISGFFAGMEFPLANRLYMKQTDHFSFHRDDPGRMVGLLCFVYLVGGLAGGILSGFFLFPALGIAQGCLALAILKAGGLLLLFTFPRK